ncbi:recombinase RecA [bacterium]|nr:recombinase RecA [Candidatus Elulimicrobium humile]
MADYLKDVIKNINNEYAGTADGDIVGDNTQFMDTGSYAFNALLSGSIFGGLPGNKITALAGEASTGKTFFALGICKTFQKLGPQAGVIYFETEGAITKEMLAERGIDPKRFVLIPVSTVQEFRTQAMKILDNVSQVPKGSRHPVLFVLDSLGNLSTEKEVADTLEGKDTRDMTRSQLIRGAFRVLALKLSKLDIPMIVTNHTYDVIGAYVPTKEMGGGGGLKYAASTIVYLSKSKDKDADKSVVGNIIKATLQKSRFTREFLRVESKLSFETGLDRYHGLTDLAIEAGIWKSEGGRIDVGSKKVFGKNISENPTEFFTDDILKQIDEYTQKTFKYGSSIPVSENVAEVPEEKEEKKNGKSRRSKE